LTILSHFPYPEVRQYQGDVINLIEKHLDNYDYIFLEAPTGLGKSAIAYALAKYMFNEREELSHFVVADIYLQNQYLRDFPDLALIKGRNNFICKMPLNMMPKHCLEKLLKDENVLTCERAPCVSDPKYQCPFKPKYEKDEAGLLYDKYGVKMNWDDVPNKCPYWEQKDKAIRSPLTIHNYFYYLNEQNFAHSFSKRELGIFDEAHTIESIMMEFVQIPITTWTLRRIQKYFERYYVPTQIPRYETLGEWSNWLLDLQSKLSEIINKMGSSEQIRKLSGENLEQVEMTILVEGLLQKVNDMLAYIDENPDNWVFTKDDNAVIFKPVVISPYSQQLFGFTRKNVLVSATILDKDKLKSYLGIDEDVKFIRVSKSSFPVEHRPLYQKFIGKAVANEMPLYRIKLLHALDYELIPPHLKYKGVIHTHTNDIANYIMENSKYKEYMVTSVGNVRAVSFEEFFASPPPCIMVTPSMKMGVDLKDDLARWQVICKVPYPYLGDPQVAKRVKMDQGWYSWQTCMSIIQTYGRVCRSDTDWGETYVLDSKFNDLYIQNRLMFPEWFSEAIRRV